MNGRTQWLFEAPFVSETKSYINPYTNPEYYSNSEWESKAMPRPKALTTPQACNEQGIPGRIPIPKKVPTTGKVQCTKAQAFGVTDPFGVVSRAVKRALEMLDNTIKKLVEARKAVCGGATPASLVDEITLCLLKNGLSVNIDDIRVWTAGTFVNGSVAEVIRRLIRVRNQIAENDNRYFCDNGRCDPGKPPVCSPGTWAWVCMPDPCPKGAKGVDRIIHLCRDFWIAGPVPLEDHAEFQAQTIIHETSHIYHCTRDPRTIDFPKNSGRTIGLAECLSQFVAATNCSPIDPSFSSDCIGINRCFPSDKVREFEISGLGSARPGSFRVAKTIFRPQNAIRLQGRPAVRR